LCACWIVVACERSCIYLLVESLWPVIGHVFMCLLNRCGLWSVMYLSANEIFNQHTNTWPITGTTIQQAHKCMTDHRQQRFNKHTNTWPTTGHNDSTSGHVFVCLLNRCCLWSVMYLCACWIVVACEWSCTHIQNIIDLSRKTNKLWSGQASLRRSGRKN
jgi:hypothetical protein